MTARHTSFPQSAANSPIDDLDPQLVRILRTMSLDELRGLLHRLDGPAPDPSSESLNLAELERRAIAEALKVAGGNRSRAAKLLGIDRATLYRKMGSGGSLPRADGSAC